MQGSLTPHYVNLWRGCFFFIILTSSTPVAEIGEPPHVAKAHSSANAGQSELYLPAPCRSAEVLIHVLLPVSPLSLIGGETTWMVG